MRNLLSLEVFGHQIRDQIKRRTHLTVGVGIGPTKTLAKLAQYASKRWPATRGVVDLSDRQRQRKLMALVPVEEVWGIGRRLGKNYSLWALTMHFSWLSCRLHSFVNSSQ